MMAPRKPVSRADAQARTVSALLEAAEHVFRTKGFARASLSEIASRAGYTKGAIYANFSSKEELFGAVVRRWQTSTVSEFFEVIVRATSADDLVRRVGAWFADEVDTSIEDYPLNGDFWVLAAKDETRRQISATAFAVGVDVIAAVIQAEADRHRIELQLPAGTIAQMVQDIQYGVLLRSNLARQPCGVELLPLVLSAAFGLGDEG